MGSAALELGEYEITANAQVPGLINTISHSAQDEETARPALATKSPLGIQWTPSEDVALMVVFLASDRTCMVSGDTLLVIAGDNANITA